MWRQPAPAWEPRIGFGQRGNALAGNAHPRPPRAPRRLPPGGPGPHHKTHLVLDTPDRHGIRRYTCHITNVSEGGFGVTLRVPGALAAAFRPGTRLTLEPATGRPERVEIRWLKGERLGIKRLQVLEDESNQAAAPPAAENEWIVDRQVGRRSDWFKCRLILDRPDAMGIREHVCRILDHSEKGFCVTVESAYPLPEISRPGAKLHLEQPNGRRVRVEVRWIKKGRIGLMMLPGAA